MKKSTIASIIAATFAITGIIVVFLLNASPYVTISQAQKGGEGVHVVGILDKESYKAELKAGTIAFVLTDESGQRMPVVYHGPPISSMMTADRVVVVGSMRHGTFEASKILVKCPSKYEGKV